MLPPTADTSTPRHTGSAAESVSRADDGNGKAVTFRQPTLHDASAMWRMARDSKVLDVNPSYAYLLWCRDFAATSVVAEVDGEPGGYVTGYLRPDRPDTLMVWQVAVDEEHRGLGLARRMLAAVVDGAPAPVRRMETTITPDNDASIALFTSFARSRDAEITRAPLFDASLFPDGHESELLFEIGPLA